MKILSCLKFNELEGRKERIAEAVSGAKIAVERIIQRGLDPTIDFVKPFNSRESFIDWVQKQAEKEVSKFAPATTRRRVYEEFHEAYDPISGDVVYLSGIVNDGSLVLSKTEKTPHIDEVKSIERATEQSTIYLDGDKLDLYIDALRGIRKAVDRLKELERADNIASAIDGSILVCRNNRYGGFYNPTIKDILEASEDADTLEAFAQEVYGYQCIVDPKSIEDNGTETQNG